MTHALTCRERLERVLRGRPVDRVPIRLWGVEPLQPCPRPCWQPLFDLVERYQLDTFFSNWCSNAPDIPERTETRDTGDPDWVEEITTLATPAGDIASVFLLSRFDRPGYEKKHLIETVEDARRWLSMPPRQRPPVAHYPALQAQVGERGMILNGLAEPAYTVNAAMGSELWGIWLYEERELLHAMVAKVARETLETVRYCLAQGIGPLFGWVGPELCIPPLASPDDFRELVLRYDRPIVEAVHDAGGLFWVHCHGDMDPVLEDFVALGIDCLNPLEPPPVGRLTLAEAKARAGGRMTLEGGIEVGDFQLDSAAQIEATTCAVMAMGKPDGRFILCPSSDHSHWPDMSDAIARNYRRFVETAMQLAYY